MSLPFGKKDGPFQLRSVHILAKIKSSCRRYPIGPGIDIIASRDLRHNNRDLEPLVDSSLNLTIEGMRCLILPPHKAAIWRFFTPIRLLKNGAWRTGYHSAGSQPGNRDPGGCFVVRIGKRCPAANNACRSNSQGQTRSTDSVRK
jgi:hypothetical protein